MQMPHKIRGPQVSNYQQSGTLIPNHLQLVPWIRVAAMIDMVPVVVKIPSKG